MINQILIALGIRKDKTGSDIVAEVTSIFDTLIDKLHVGLHMIDDDIEFNQDDVAKLRIQIEEIKQKNTVHGEAKVKTLNLIRGIEGLINGS